MASNPPIVVCSTRGDCWPVMQESIAHYVPDEVQVYWSSTENKSRANCIHFDRIITMLPNTADNFGDAYNAAVQAAFNDGHEAVIVANDDIVLTPTSYQTMLEDMEFLKGNAGLFNCNMGWVAARSDWARGSL